LAQPSGRCRTWLKMMPRSHNFVPSRNLLFSAVGCHFVSFCGPCKLWNVLTCFVLITLSGYEIKQCNFNVWVQIRNTVKYKDVHNFIHHLITASISKFTNNSYV
jgi:hypothetical protein